MVPAFQRWHCPAKSDTLAPSPWQPDSRLARFPMSENVLQTVAEQVLSRAQEQGFVVPRDIRADLSQAGLADTRWKEVLALVQPRLRFRHGRYYYVTTIAAHMRTRAGYEHRHQLAVQHAVRQMIHRHRPEPVSPNRRRYRRIPLGCSVLALAEDRRELRLLCSDISLGGIRLVSPASLQDQTLCIRFPGHDSLPGEAFRVRILWSTAAGDGLFQNGGVFLELATEADWLKLVAP